jgi:menaquinone-dependent protoporphyrinogen oxidase
MQEEAIINSELNQNFTSDLIKLAKAKEYLGGEFILSKMNFIERLIVKKVSKVTSDKSFILEANVNKFAEAMNA